MKKVRGRPKNPPKVKEMLKEVIPTKEIFDEEEESLYNSLVDIYLGDFEEDELTSSDMDDIMTLAMNRVLELRLLKTSKSDVDKQIDVSQAIERIRKQTEKVKDNLSSRRKDRIDPNKYKGFSIVDLVVAFDENKKLELTDKVKKLGENEVETKQLEEEYAGNRYDSDIDQKDEDEEST